MTGLKTDGIAMDARIATSSGPVWNQISRCASKSVATAVYGMARSSMRTLPMMRSSRLITRSSLIRPGAFREGRAIIKTSVRDSRKAVSVSSWRRPAA